MSKSVEVPFIAPSAHIPPALSPPPRYSPGKNPRFLYLYNRKFLVLISLLLFLIAITLIVGVTLICFSRINGSKELEKSKSDVSKERPRQSKLGEPSDEDANTPHNLRVPEKNDDDNRPLSQRMEPQKLGPAESEKEEKTSSQGNSQANTPLQEGDRENAEAPQATEEMENQADKRRLVLRVEPQKLEGSQQQKKEATRPAQVHLSAQEATMPPQESMPQHAKPSQRAEETAKPVNQPPERTKPTVKPFIPPRERNIIPCDETCKNGGAVASCCRAHRMSDGICDESGRAICWKD